MKKILHISNDDRFIVKGKKIFDQVPETHHDFWVFSNSEDFKHIDFEAENLFNVEIFSEEFIQRINHYDFICIHFLNPKLYPLFKAKKIIKPVLWIGWGGDYYWLLNSYKDFNIYLPKTQRLVEKVPLQTYFQDWIKKIQKSKNARKIQGVNQIDYFAPVFKSEYELILKNYPNFKPQFIEWNYGHIDHEVKGLYSALWRKGDKIMIGNSATPTNNHIDVLEDLNQILRHEALVFPLNYGHPLYKSYIAQHVRRKFKTVEVIENLMPENEFAQIMLECKSLIIGSMRQQAVATILMALYFGINVFLYKDSLNYKFFKEHQIKVFAIEDLKSNPALLNESLSHEQILENRELINHFWSMEKNAKTIANLLESVMS